MRPVTASPDFNPNSSPSATLTAAQSALITVFSDYVCLSTRFQLRFYYKRAGRAYLAHWPQFTHSTLFRSLPKRHNFALTAAESKINGAYPDFGAHPDAVAAKHALEGSLTMLYAESSTVFPPLF